MVKGGEGFLFLQFEIYYSLIEVFSSNPPPEPNASLTITQILAKALVSVIDRSRGLSKGMEIVRTIRPGRGERTTTRSDIKQASEME